MTKQEFIEKTLEVLTKEHISYTDFMEQYGEISIDLKRPGVDKLGPGDVFCIDIAYDDVVTFSTVDFRVRVPYGDVAGIESCSGRIKFRLNGVGSIRTGKLALH